MHLRPLRAFFGAIYFSVFSINASLAVQEETSCLEKLRMLYAQLEPDTGRVLPHRAYRLRYSVRTEPRDPAQVSPSDGDVEVLVRGGHVRLQSRELSFYQDTEDAFTVLRGRKIVYWNLPTSDAVRHARANTLGAVRAILFRDDAISECVPLTGSNEEPDLKIVLEVEPSKQLTLNMQRINFTMNSKAHRLHTVSIGHPASNALVSTTIVFHELNYAYETAVFDTAVRNLFLDPKNKLLANFEGYRLIDRRPPAVQAGKDPRP